MSNINKVHSNILDNFFKPIQQTNLNNVYGSSEADAARYRAFREAVVKEDCAFLNTVASIIEDGGELTPELIDKAMDAARNAQ